MKGSWRTTVIGWGEGVVLAAIGVVHDQGVPHTWQGWLFFVAGVLRGIAGTNTKDAQVSNAPNPLPESQPVK